MHEQKINIITLRMRHHANTSGYDQLVNYLNANIIPTNRHLTILQRALAYTFGSKISSSNSLWYHRANFIAEINAARKYITNKEQIFHFLYGENSYRYLGKLKSLRKENHIVCTYHTPPARLKELITNNNFLKALDAVIVVSTVQFEYFADILGLERVHYVPHGIDTTYYLPNKNRTNKSKLYTISVGSHLRDFQTLADVANIFKTENICFIVVAPVKYHHYFDGIKNVELHSSISSENLLKLYQLADLLLLPLLDCTANNAILEGMSCGLPVISTDLPGVKDYVDKNCSVLTPKGDSKALADAVYSLCENKDNLIKLGKYSRARALEFEWTDVAKKIQDIYALIANY